MIPFDIDYAKPTTVSEAVEIYRDAAERGQTARYMSGGTELVTSARDGKLSFDLLIDLKQIPETASLDNDDLNYGACLRLSDMTDRAELALLRHAAAGVADRTARNSITLAGNVCGMLPYREAVLPFLLFDGFVTVAGSDGTRTVALADAFEKRLKLSTGEFVVSLTLDKQAREAQTFYRRRTRDPRVDYPLVTLCMARMDGAIRLAVGGAFGFPVRSSEVEQLVTEGASRPLDGAGRKKFAAEAAESFSESYWEDLRGSADYRKALLAQAVEEGLEALGGRA